jgi:hypothetical protein
MTRPATARRLPEGPRPITVTIDGYDRLWVADALIDAAIAIERDAAGRRQNATITQVQIARAGRLRALAAQVR